MTTTTYQALTITRTDERLLRAHEVQRRQAREAASAIRAASRCRRAFRALAALRPLPLVRRSSAHRLRVAACGC